MERRLSAIMSADVVGYSRLMGANEVGTLMALKACRSEAIEPAVQAQGGRIFKLVGDGVLVEFSSVVNAVECATIIQQTLRTRNADLPDDRKIELRIGINVGDVIIDEDDIYGDGVNVAARIESVARTGGIAVSKAVRDHVGNRLDVAFQDRGDQQLKNIAVPVHVYDVVSNVEGQAVDPTPSAKTNGAKPSIGVLPFANMSDDPEQDYFSDGICEDIITDLSRLSGLFVVGLNATFGYKGKSVSPQATAAELGVAHLLEGSVRKAGQRIRVTAQLIDGASAGHLWAERFDRDLTDIFAIQDEISKAIVDQLRVRLLPEEKKALGQAPTDNVDAYTYYLKGRQLFQNATESFLGLARQMFVKAVELDPLFARAYAGIVNCDNRLAGWYGLPIPTDEILETANKALALDFNLPEVHAARGDVLSNRGRYSEAAEEFERALKLDPNSYEANYFFGRSCFREGDLGRAAELFKRALEIQPEDSQAPFLLQLVLRSMGRNAEAHEYARLGLKRAEEAVRINPAYSRPLQLGATALAAMGEKKEAKRWLERALAIDPDDNNARYNAACTYAQLGEEERALDLLELWLDHVSYDSRKWFVHDADFEPLSGHPRFQRLVQLID